MLNDGMMIIPIDNLSKYDRYDIRNNTIRLLKEKFYYGDDSNYVD